MLRQGMYRSIKEYYTSEKHGGATLTTSFFWFLCFSPKENRVGLFGASKNFHDPYINNQIDLHGKITSQKAETIEFYIYNNDIQEKIIYTGRLTDDRLFLTYYHESEPTKIFEDVYVYIGNGK